MEGQRMVSNFGFSFSEIAARLKRRDGRIEIQKTANTRFNVSLDTRKLRRRLRKLEDSKGLVTVRTQNALKGERFQKERVKKCRRGFRFGFCP